MRTCADKAPSCKLFGRHCCFGVVSSHRGVGINLSVLSSDIPTVIRRPTRTFVSSTPASVLRDGHAQTHPVCHNRIQLEHSLGCQSPLAAFP
jgi:hypothetical protein